MMMMMMMMDDPESALQCWWLRGKVPEITEDIHNRERERESKRDREGGSILRMDD